ncbi:MAG: CoA ester lyase [Burkholderiales bacterium]|nr:CoA ester lyase [Burkholderiales bacterium]
MHPSQALFQQAKPPVFLPVCDHYAGSEKLMLKSMALQNEIGAAFDISFDCEDGAAVGQEVAQAQLISRLIASSDNRHQHIGARVHPINHTLFESDVRHILEHAAQKIAYLVLPKVNSASEVTSAIQFIQTQAQRLGREHLPVHALIETHEALAQVHAIAAIEEIECLSFGIMDFVSEHHGAIPAEAMRSPAQFSHPLVLRAKVEIAAACHRFGKVASHNVCTDFKDTDIVASDATRAAKECGYTRMWSIHPNQIPAIIKAFAPAANELDDAVAILLAAQKNNWGPIEHHGRLHDRASYRYYWSVLKKASLSSQALPDSALHLI